MFGSLPPEPCEQDAPLVYALVEHTEADHACLRLLWALTNEWRTRAAGLADSDDQWSQDRAQALGDCAAEVRVILRERR